MSPLQLTSIKPPCTQEPFWSDCECQGLRNDWLELVKQNLRLMRNIYPSTRVMKKRTPSHKPLKDFNKVRSECSTDKKQESDDQMSSTEARAHCVDPKEPQKLAKAVLSQESTYMKPQSGQIKLTSRAGKLHRRLFVPGVGWISAKKVRLVSGDAIITD